MSTITSPRFRRHVGVAWLPALMVLLAAAGVGALTGTHPRQGVTVAVVLCGTAVLVLNPRLATLVVVVLLYSNAAVIASTVHGLPGFVTAAVLLLLLIPLIDFVLMRHEPIVLLPALPWLVGYLIMQVVGAARAIEPAIAMQNLQVFLLEGFCLFMGISNVVRTPAMLRRVLWSLLAVGAVLGALSLHQFLTGSFDQNYLGFAQNSDVKLEMLRMDPFGDNPPPRLGGPVGGQNRYAQIMLMLVPFGLIAARGAIYRWYRVTAVVATVLILIGATLTFSRGGAVGFVLLVMIMTVMGYLRGRHLVALALIVGCLMVAFPRYTERLSSLPDAVSLVTDADSGSQADGAVRGRLSSSIGAMRVFAVNPLLGVGPGMYPQYHRAEAIEIGLRVEQNRQPHSLLPHVAAESGAIGLIMFLGVIAVTLSRLRAARRALRRLRPDLADLMAAFTLSVWTYLATGLFLHLSYERYFWLLMALSGAAAAVGSRQAEILIDARKRPRTPAEAGIRG